MTTLDFAELFDEQIARVAEDHLCLTGRKARLQANISYAAYKQILYGDTTTGYLSNRFCMDAKTGQRKYEHPGVKECTVRLLPSKEIVFAIIILPYQPCL